MDDVSFARRVRTSVAADPLVSLPESELVDLALGSDDELAGTASSVLLGRLAGVVDRASGVACVRLAHLGRPGQCRGHRCHEAFPSARADFAARTVGRYYGAIADGTSRFIEMQPDRKPRVAARRSVIGSWSQRADDHADSSLAAFVHADLNASGRTTDARRRWNKDRGLLVRMNVPVSVVAAAQQILAQHVATDVLRVAATASIGLDIRSWANALYDDACENAPDSRPIYHHRVARAVGLVTGPDVVGNPERRAIDAVDALIEHACRLVGDDLYDRAFVRARAVTRPLSAYGPDRCTSSLVESGQR